MSWTYDAPTQTYKNHALSSNLRHAAVANSHLFRWLSPEPGYGKGKGDTITVTRMGNLPLAGRVGETDLLPTGIPPKSTVSRSVGEWGYAVPITELETNLTHFNLRNQTQMALRDQMRLTLDKMAADEYKLTVLRARTNGAALDITTNGIFGGTASRNLNIDDLKAIYDYFSGTQKVPEYENGKLIGILSTKAARGIKDDATYAAWGAAAQSVGPMSQGRLFDVEGFSLFETNHFDALSNAVGANATGEALFFGADHAFLALVSDPELRAGLKTDLGRFQDLGWVGTLEAGLTWPEAADARIMYFGSA